jgi:iron complex outermembrane recepter protein
MKFWQFSTNCNLRLLVILSGCLSALVIQPGWAQGKSRLPTSPYTTKVEDKGLPIPQLSEIELPATSAKLLVQQPAPTNTNPEEVIAITGVKANPTEKGVEVILETTAGDKLQVANRSTGNNFIVDVAGGQLRLPNGDAFAFKSEKPIEGITEITVTNIDVNTVRITVVGEKALPAVELFDDDTGLIFAVASTAISAQTPETPTEEKPAEEKPEEQPAAQQDDPIELVVTGEADSYRVPNASTATLTDTPLRDIPQSIQVVPQEVLRDRKVRSVNEAVQTVSGVVDGGTIYGAPSGIKTIRGFTQGFAVGGTENLRNGVPDADYIDIVPIGTIEQVEVLKGPASVLFGGVEPGGVINTITKQPLGEPYYQIGFEAGNYGYYQPSIDLSGPLTADKTVLYRLIAGYEHSNNIQPFVDQKLTTIAPSLTLNLGSQTKLDLYYEYARFLADYPLTDPAILSDGSLTPRNLYLSYPNISLYDITNHRFGYALTHKFSDNLQLRHNLAISLADFIDNRAYPIGLEDDRFIELEGGAGDYSRNRYFGRIDLLAKFETGSISHQLLFGFDATRFVNNSTYLSAIDIPVFDILNPNYDYVPELVPGEKSNTQVENYAVYIQDQIAFSDNWKLLIGGRYDWIRNDTEITDFGIFGNTEDEPIQNDGAFSPRIGLVYQPSDNVSLYASYSQSFRQTLGFNPDGRVFKPSKGTQYEIGLKTDFLDRKLSATLAAYQITKTNVTTEDPDNRRFQIQTGEQRSRGVELDVTGEILPGWKIIASYAYTNAEITKDNVFAIGNRLKNVPEHQASLWTTYEIKKGSLQGLGFGLGLFYVGERQGDLDNTFQVDSYLRTDAALYYRRDGFNAAINIRNLFDNDYITYASDPPSAQRGDPFTIVGSISWEF